MNRIHIATIKKQLSKFSFVYVLLFFCFTNCSTSQTKNDKAVNTDSIYTYGKQSEDGIGKFYMDREIAHVISASGAAWLERNGRPQEENTNLAIEKMQLQPNAVVADIGAGTGYYTFKMAAQVPQGKVFAVEIQDEMIGYLKDKKNLLQANNVVIIKGGITSPNLPADSIDLAVMVDVYHELEYPHEMLQSIKSSLKKDGKILLMEYRGEDPKVAIKKLHKTTVEQLNKEFKANGFSLYYDGEFLPIQHFLVYKKEE